MPIPGKDARGIIPELKQDWTWCGFCLFVCFSCSVCLFYCCGVFLIFIFIPIFFLYYQPYHHPLLIPTLTSFNLLPSPVLKSSNSSPAFISHSPPTCYQTNLPSYTLTICWANYYTIFTQPQPPAIPNTNPHTTITEIHPDTQKGHKTHQHHTTSCTHTPHFPPPLLVSA
jgi:hypothetical protein